MWAFSSELDKPPEGDSTGVTQGQGQSASSKSDLEATGAPGSSGKKDSSGASVRDEPSCGPPPAAAGYAITAGTCATGGGNAGDRHEAGSEGDGRVGKGMTGEGATGEGVGPAGGGDEGENSAMTKGEGDEGEEGKEGEEEKQGSAEGKKVSLWAALRGPFQRPKGEKPPAPSTIPYYRLFSCADHVDILLLIAGTIGAIAHGSTLPVFFLLFGNVVDALGTNDTSMIPQYALYIVYEAAAVWVASWLGECH